MRGSPPLMQYFPLSFLPSFLPSFLHSFVPPFIPSSLMFSLSLIAVPSYLFLVLFSPHPPFSFSFSLRRTLPYLCRCLVVFSCINAFGSSFMASFLTSYPYFLPSLFFFLNAFLPAFLPSVRSCLHTILPNVFFSILQHSFTTFLPS